MYSRALRPVALDSIRTCENLVGTSRVEVLILYKKAKIVLTGCNETVLFLKVIGLG